MTEASERTVDEQQAAWYSRITLAQALLLAIGAALLIVAVGYSLYWNDSNRKYDLARPGQQSENKVLDVEDAEADTTSPVDKQAIDQKVDYLVKELKALDGLGSFEPSDLSDEAIQLTPTTNQPSL